MKREYLDEQLEQYQKSEIYPFHMPGHKRRSKRIFDAYALDITEINGFDNLHRAKGILKQAQEHTAELYGAEKSFFLVNGSTAGILSAISAVTKKGDKLLMARNSHKSVYNAVFLRELKAEYLYPQITKEGIPLSVTPEAVETALQKHSDTAAVILTSPTYDGVISDIEKIAERVHERGLPLIVDEAHGAHLGFSERFPDSAVHKGADIVIQSLHKTLPALTQSAVLHICSHRVSEAAIQKYLSIYQTSSPSYVLMASMDYCNRILETRGKEVFEEYEQKLYRFYQGVKGLRHLRVVTAEDLKRQGAYDADWSKIIIYTGGANLSGEELSNILRKKYRLELEMESGYYALAMTSILDEEEGYQRLVEALWEIDAGLCKSKKETADFFAAALYGEKERVCSVCEAEMQEKKSVLLRDAAGAVSAEYVFLYPPGIPVLVPGERIGQEVLNSLRESRKKNLNLSGLCGETNERINIVIF